MEAVYFVDNYVLSATFELTKSYDSKAIEYSHTHRKRNNCKNKNS